MTNLIRILSRMGWTDVIDILLVSLLFYFIFRLIRGTRTTVPQRGYILMLLASVVIYFLAEVASLSALRWIFQNLGVVMILILIVVFQNDLRRGLADLGRLKLVRSLFSSADEGVSEIVRAAGEMSQRRIGALIVLERDVALRGIIEKGTPLEARVTCELIRTIFTTPAPLHDGALIVRGNRLAAAGCILPLTTNETLARELGTRHRAALGLTEETDAIVIVVSEETGKISLAVDGELIRPLESEQLSERLTDLLGVNADGK